jgi:arginase
VSRLRARCPDCRTLTAVALGSEYQCHSCGREFAAGLIRVPKAWGEGGEAMAEAASLPLPFPEAGVVEEDSLHEQTLAVAAELPDRALVLGGCCCAHLGAIVALASRVDRLALVWLDAHGDLNTPQTSPSGNAWGMPLRMALDSGAVEPADVALVGVRALDLPEEQYVAAAGIRMGGAEAVERAVERTDCVYVALDGDVFEPAELRAFMPEPGGPTVDEVRRLLEDLAARRTIVGAGFSGLVPDPGNLEPLGRITAALGFS